MNGCNENEFEIGMQSRARARPAGGSFERCKAFQERESLEEIMGI